MNPIPASRFLAHSTGPMRKGKPSTGLQLTPSPTVAPVQPDVQATCQRCRTNVYFTRSGVFGVENKRVSKDTDYAWIPAGLQKQLPQTHDEFLMTLYQLFEYAAETMGHDQPHCAECSQYVLQQLQNKEKTAVAKHEAYKHFLKQLEQDGCTESSDEGSIEGDSHSTEQLLEAEYKQLQAEEQELLGQLHDVASEWQEVEDSKGDLTRQEDDIRVRLDDCRREYNKSQIEKYWMCDRAAALDQQCHTDTEELNRLNNASIYNEAFHISCDGHFGTINNFRLGRISSQKVDWSEMNAAWGHAACLLDTIKRTRGITFTKYQVLPCGSSSVVMTIEGGKGNQYDLYGGGQGMMIFASRKYDRAMVGFLTCLDEIIQQELARYNLLPSATGSPMKVPYPIEGDKIGSLSIKLSNNSEEKWTKALKYMLTDLKWVVKLITMQDLQRAQDKLLLLKEQQRQWEASNST